MTHGDLNFHASVYFENKMYIYVNYNILIVVLIFNTELYFLTLTLGIFNVGKF